MIQESIDSNGVRQLAGGYIAGCDQAAFTLKSRVISEIPVLIAVPHAGRCYPDHILANMRDAESSTIRLEDRFADNLAIDIADQTGAALLVANAPRAILDLNRSIDDIDWGMIRGGSPATGLNSQANRRARSGLGLVPRRLNGLGEIWKDHLPARELEERIEGIHKPYHHALSQELENIRDQWGAALLIDLHSMPPLRQRRPDMPAPQFILGDRFGISCDNSLIDAAIRHFEWHGKMVGHNRPYAGGYVLDRHAVPRRQIHALQLEVCRSTYLDSRQSQLSARKAAVAKLIAELTRKLGELTAQLADNGRWAQAAE